MKKKDWIYLLLLLMVLGYSVYRYVTNEFTVKESRILLDTFVEINVVSSNKNITVAVDSAFVLIAGYDDRFSYFNPESEVSQMNNATSDSVIISNELAEMLLLAEKLYHESDSLYDVTIGNLADLWNFDEPVVPSEQAIRTAQTATGFHKMKLENNMLKRPPGFRINLGSIAKGYIVDKAVELLQSYDVSYGYINAGGDIRYFGEIEPHWVGIRHPRDSNAIIDTLYLQQCAVVTSGDYERYFIVDGVRYHHIINPKTGLPVENTISVTVIAPNAFLADALSTALFLMPPEKAIELSKSYHGVDAVIYYRSGEDIISMKSSGMKVYLKP
ncbi:MAG: FAD:protein FMN transferase [Candidatus Cloacimonetes bacterium]|nr:FAD:protein FMN transferase [Candidatus Cloacimonadota bacterium]